jgi:hypothetical protein
MILSAGSTDLLATWGQFLIILLLLRRRRHRHCRGEMSNIINMTIILVHSEVPTGRLLINRSLCQMQLTMPYNISASAK